MARKQQKLGEGNRRRIDEFLTLFAREEEQIRQELVSSIPAYNQLLSIHAKTFEELALLPIAIEQGMDYQDLLFDYTAVKPYCPHCQQTKFVRKIGENSYICNRCKKKFAANWNSISSGSKCTSLTYMKILNCIMNHFSLKQTCKACNIASNTYYAVRNRLFYAMSIMMDEVKLYGQIQCDNTYVKVNYRGMNLEDRDYPDDSPFYTVDFIPRKARKRGGSYLSHEKNQNHICIFTAIDELGHVVVRQISIGAPSESKLSNAIGASKILSTVPEKDPFLYHTNTTDINPSLSSYGNQSLLIADGEKSIEAFSNKRGIAFESHVYSRDGVYLKLSTGSNNIQRVNSLHRRLKDFLRKCNYVSSKYLPGYLLLFEFIENTGASTKAIGRLFEILASPGLGKPSSFYKDLYTTPNYMMEWSNEKNPFGKFKEEQLLAGYLYHKKLKNSDSITMEEISKQTSYSASSIRRLYKNFAATGYLELLEAKYESTDNFNAKKRRGRKKSISPEILAIYDEYIAMLIQQSPGSRVTKKDFLVSMNQKYGTHYSLSSFLYYCKVIQEMGLRKPLLDSGYKGYMLGYSPKAQIKPLKFIRLYESMISDYLSKNLEPPSRIELLKEISARESLAVETIYHYICKGRHLKKEYLRQGRNPYELLEEHCKLSKNGL